MEGSGLDGVECVVHVDTISSELCCGVGGCSNSWQTGLHQLQ